MDAAELITIQLMEAKSMKIKSGYIERSFRQLC